VPDSTPLIDVRLVDDAIDYAPFVPAPQPGGGECVFLGRTRTEARADAAALVALAYEAYRPMAERVLLDLARDAATRHGAAAVRIVHRLGRVPLGEASVLVQVVTGHRDAAFGAAREIIDALKTVAPIWKREEWSDGATTWSEGRAAIVDP
jgi:molybdopterin synthase catalytic subunit